MMNRYYSFSILLLLSFFSSDIVAESDAPEFCPQYSSDVRKATIIGEVRDTTSNKPLYCEYHLVEKEANKKTRVEYRNIDQTLIATKSIDYSPSLTRPNIVQKDLRHNELRSAILDSSDSSSITVSYRKPDKSDTHSAQIKSSDSLVIDAGFDEAIREYWYTLVSGEKLVIDFLSPVHLNTIKLTVKKSTAKSCYKEAYDT